MMYIKVKSVIPLAIVLLAGIIAQEGMAQEQLKRYTDEGIRSNLVLKQKHISLKQAQLGLKEARSWYLPSVELLGDYTTAKGGRTIDFPIGDLLNPVYTSLNHLTGSDKFPAMENQAIQLMPSNFYDAKIRVSYPLLNTEIYMNEKIRRQEVLISDLEQESYRQDLIHEIETAYYTYCLSIDAADIYRNALLLVGRNLQVNRSLAANGKGLAANVLRAESEVEQVKAKLNEAENQVLNSRSWFNLLLNREQTDSIIYERQDIPDDLAGILAGIPDTRERSELKQLKAAISIQHSVIDLHRFNAYPKINTFVDLGSQASDFEFSGNSRYILAGLQMKLPIYSGSRNRIEIASSKLVLDDLQLKTEITENQLTLAASVAKHNLSTAVINLHSSEIQLESSKAYFKLIEKGYSEGVNSLIEFVDARNLLTTAEIQIKLNTYKVLMANSDYRRQTAVSTLQNSAK